MLIIVGASGSGKSTVCKKLVKNYGYKTVILSTTRLQREGETNDIDYNFLSEKSFNELAETDCFLSISEYNSWKYGIPKPKGYPDDYVIVATPADMRYIKKTSEIKNIYTAYIKTDRRDRMIIGLKRGDNIDEVYRRSLSDEGQFDGLETECDFTIHNKIEFDNVHKENIDNITSQISAQYFGYLYKEKMHL